MNTQMKQQKTLIISKKSIQEDISWMNESKSYSNLSNQQIVMQNKAILETLKKLQNKLNQQLKKVDLRNVKQLSNYNKSDSCKILDDKIKNNQKLIHALTNDKKSIQMRTQKIVLGLQSKTNQKKYDIESLITSLKQQIKKMKLDYHQSQKILENHKDQGSYEGVVLHNRLEEELRCYSVKYVRILDKYNKSVQKLASLSTNYIPPVQIPQEIFNQQLQEKQLEQFKQYQGIAKLCTVLEKRNDSQHNKAHRIYNQKLRQLEKVISNLAQIDKMVSQRQTQILQTRKYIQMIKIKLTTKDTVDQLRQVSNDTQILRNKSYSTSKLQTTKILSDLRTVRNRGNSFIKFTPTKNKAFTNRQ